MPNDQYLIRILEVRCRKQRNLTLIVARRSLPTQSQTTSGPLPKRSANGDHKHHRPLPMRKQIRLNSANVTNLWYRR